MNKLEIKNTFDWFKNNWFLINQPYVIVKKF